jgi:hypothetical protein
MKVFCRLFGHTWVFETRAPFVRWNTTKDGQILTPTVTEESVRHVMVCRRCGEERPDSPRRHDADRPTITAPAVNGEEEAEE